MVSDLQEKRCPKLNRLLRRNIDFSLSTDNDFAFLWSAYRRGSFDFIDNNLEKSQFVESFEAFLIENGLTPFSFYAEIGGKVVMVGIGLFLVNGAELRLDRLIWFKWASSRVVLESYVNFVNTIRRKSHDVLLRKFYILVFTNEKNKRFFDHVCAYGVMRRVGTSEEFYGNEKSCIYESRSVR